MSFQGKRVLITGGSSGIGLALARQLAAEGAEITILARDADRLRLAVAEIEQTAGDLTAPVSMLSVDVTDWESVEQELSRWAEQGGAPDIIFNSAGVAHPGYAHELGVDIYQWMIDVNYLGTVHVNRVLLPPMLERGTGHIVNIASVAGFLGVPGYTAYGASKFAVRGYSDALRAELNSSDLRVSIAYPPDTRTPQLDYENQFKPALLKAMTAGDEPWQAEDVAEVILQGVSKGRYLIIPGFINWFYYWLSGALGPLLYPVMDLYINRSRASISKS